MTNPFDISLEGLTAQRRAFVSEYLVDFNATQAAIRAGYSKKTARQQGSKLLRDERLKGALTAAIQSRVERVGQKADQVLEWLEELAGSDISDAIEWGPDGVVIKESSSLSPAVLRMVSKVVMQEIETTTVNSTTISRRTELAFHPKTPALTLLAKHHGLLPNQLGPDSGPVQININAAPSLDLDKLSVETRQRMWDELTAEDGLLEGEVVAPA